MPRFFHFCAAVGLLSLACSQACRAAEKLRFNRDIRPILSDKCFHCHGPDPKKRDSGLRLDVREEAIKERDGIRAIVPGKPDESDMLVRIASHDKDEMMPPPKSKLGAADAGGGRDAAAVDRGGRGVREALGFHPAAAGRPRRASMRSWRRASPRAGSKPQPEADRNTLIRRVSFDLTGLPPTPAEVAAFVKDDAPGRLRDGSWIGCSPRRATASAWRWIGSTCRATRTATASRSIASATCGRGATG